MTMTGHNTRSVFERYNVTSADDLDRAADQLSDVSATAAAVTQTATFPRPRHGSRPSASGWQPGTIRAESPR
jgi:hypothetical protein